MSRRSWTILGTAVLLLAGCDRARPPGSMQGAQACERLTDGQATDPCSRAFLAAKTRADSFRALQHHDSAPRFKDDHL